MKQLDTEALMDMQNQQDRLSKNKMKHLVMQELANQTGTPYVRKRAKHDPAKQAGVMRQLKSDSDYQEALDDRVSDYRSEVGEMLSAQTQTEIGKKSRWLTWYPSTYPIMFHGIIRWLTIWSPGERSKRLLTSM